MSKKEVVKKDEMPSWETLDEVIEYFNHGITAAMMTLTRIMWEAGRAGDILQTESKYGDNAIEEFAKGIHKGTSWVYECIKMYKAYQWEEIQEKFLKAGIPASSIARLGAIKDEGARNYVEDKLVNGEITYEDISKTKKEYETVINNPEVTHDELGDNGEMSMEEIQASRNLEEDDPDNVAAGSIRAFCGTKTRACQELKRDIENKAYEKLDSLDMISNGSLYDLSTQRLAEFAQAQRDLAIVLNNVAESIELKCNITVEAEAETETP